jgi:predicted MFS family arabinose efflux permease
MTIVPREDRATSLGWLGTGQAMSMGLAFLAGGGLVGQFGWQAPFWLFAGSGFLAVILLALCLPKDAGSESGDEKVDSVSSSEDLSIGERGGTASLSRRIAAEIGVLRHRDARNVVIATIFNAMADGALAFWFIAMLRSDHDLSVMDATLLTVALFVAQLPGGVVCGRFADSAERKWERGRTRLGILCSVVSGVLYFGLLLIPWSELSLFNPACLLFCVLAVIGAFISAALPPLLFNAATEVVPRPQREVMISAVSVSRIAGRALGVQCVGLLTALLSSSSLSLSIAIVTLCFLPSAFLLQRIAASETAA